MRNAFLKGSLIVASTHLAVVGCGGSNDDGGGGLSGSGGASASGGSAGKNGKGGSGGTIITGGVSGAGATSGAGGTVDPDAACVADSVDGARAVVALYFMVDISGSMNCPVPEQDPPCEVDPGQNFPDTRWTEAAPALQSFFGSPDVTGMWAGIDFFSQNGSCNSNDYENPTVEIAALPANATAINMAIGNQDPSGQTPTVPSITGAVEHAQDWATSHGDHTAVVVYLTDGYPRGCGVNANDPASVSARITEAAGIAADAFGASPSVRTYVLGIGPNLDDLNQIAVSGGTGQAFFITTGQDVGAQLVDALNDIRDDVAIDCTYSIPAPPPGRQLNYSEVNVRVTDSSGTSTDIFRSSDCMAGWQYSPDMTQIILCGSTCEMVQNDPGSRMEVLFGCSTVSEPPR